MLTIHQVHQVNHDQFPIKVKYLEQRNVPNIFVSTVLKSLVGKYSIGPKVAIPALFIRADSFLFPNNFLLFL